MTQQPATAQTPTGSQYLAASRHNPAPLITTRLLRHEKVTEAIARELEQQLTDLQNPIFHGTFS